MDTKWILLLQLLSLTGCHFLSSYDRYSSRGTRTDRYGTYSYDQYGYRTYSRCLDYEARTRDQCRTTRGRDDYGYNSDRYNSYGRYDDYNNLRGKVNVGRGTFHLKNRGRDAELTCEFPRGSHLISNIVWERVRDRNYSDRSRYDSLRDWFGSRMEVRRIGDHGSYLIIRDYEERDAGIYRCFATRTYDRAYDSYRRHSYSGGYSRTETIYMEVEFYPERRGGAYNDYFSSSSNNYYSNYRPSYNWRTSTLEASEDTVVLCTASGRNGADDQNTE